MPPSETLRKIRDWVSKILKESHELYNQTLLPALNEAGINIIPYAELSGEQSKYAEEYFHETVFPVLTPLAFDPGRPFTHISNLSRSVGVVLLTKPKGREPSTR